MRHNCVSIQIYSLILTIGFALLLSLSAKAESKTVKSEKPLRVVFVSPQNEDSRFWYLAHNFARAAARDLDIEFDIYYNDQRHRHTYLKAFERAFNAHIKPDFIIGIFLSNVGHPILEMSQETGIPVFMVNSNVPYSEKKLIGDVRGKYKTFIGHMYPDEWIAGYMLAEKLIRIAKRHKQNKDIQLLGLTGKRESPVAVARINGLEAASINSQVELVQTVYTDWTPEKAAKRAQKLLKRHTETDVIWFASDDMALKTKEIGLDKKYIMGGFDWRKKALEAIKNKELAASAGGHFTEIGFALVLLYDYFNGIDFIDQFPRRIPTKMKILTQDNIDKYYDFLTAQDWDKVDFTSYSKIHNPDLEKYDFSFETMLEAKPN